jgi:hypothetical protein
VSGLKSWPSSHEATPRPPQKTIVVTEAAYGRDQFGLQNRALGVAHAFKAGYVTDHAHALRRAFYAHCGEA